VDAGRVSEEIEWLNEREIYAIPIARKAIQF
jgi:hypothetical protein